MEIFLYSPFSNLILTIVSITSLLSFIVVVLRLQTKKLSVPNNLPLPPGKFGWPLIGETIDFARLVRAGRLDRFIFDRMNRYSPKVFKTSLLGEKVAVLCGPQGNKFVFSNENTLVKWWIPPSLMKILLPVATEDMTSFSTRERHLPEFLKPSALRNYVEMLHSTVWHHMDAEWAPRRTEISVRPAAKKLGFTLVCRLFMGIEDPTLIEMLRDQLEIVVAGMFAVHVDLPGTTLRRATNAAKFILYELQSIIKKQVSTGNPSMFVAHLVVATDGEGKLLSEKKIANLVFGALLGGYETTGTIFTSLVHFLTHHPHVYARALTEQTEIRNLKGGGEVLNWEDIKRMRYGRQVINEVLRLTPTSVAGGFREVLHDISYQGFTIPKGWKIFWTVNSTHKDPKYFPDPEKFDPTRFDGDSRVPDGFSPFGGGPRMCPGNEYVILATLLFMHNLLLNFTWENPTSAAAAASSNENMTGHLSSFGPADKLSIKLRRQS